MNDQVLPDQRLDDPGLLPLWDDDPGPAPAADPMLTLDGDIWGPEVVAERPIEPLWEDSAVSEAPGGEAPATDLVLPPILFPAGEADVVTASPPPRPSLAVMPGRPRSPGGRLGTDPRFRRGAAIGALAVVAVAGALGLRALVTPDSDVLRQAGGRPDVGVVPTAVSTTAPTRPAVLLPLPSSVPEPSVVTSSTTPAPGSPGGAITAPASTSPPSTLSRGATPSPTSGPTTATTAAPRPPADDAPASAPPTTGTSLAPKSPPTTEPDSTRRPRATAPSTATTAVTTTTAAPSDTEVDPSVPIASGDPLD